MYSHVLAILAGYSVITSVYSRSLCSRSSGPSDDFLHLWRDAADKPAQTLRTDECGYPRSEPPSAIPRNNRTEYVVSRFPMIAVVVSVYFCSRRAAPTLQSFAFHSEDPVSTTALLSQLGAAIFLLTVELGVAFILQSRWLPPMLAPLAWVAAVTAFVHLLFPAHRPLE